MGMDNFQILTKLFYILVFVSFAISQNPEVQTNLGKIKGYTTNQNTTSITKFLGIPFAKPPVGPLRFQKPVKPDAWTNVLDSKNYRDSCVEASFGVTFNPLNVQYNQSEDCLYLNVFVPGDFQAALSYPKAVMVWIYGGGFLLGASNVYPGDLIAMSQDVIVVTFNYRMGLIGFMATADGSIPGNMGLFDQNAALTWVKENIVKFGGDASKITIFGESAGAESSFLHLMSPMSKNLFQRAIIQSAPSASITTKEQKYLDIKEILKPDCPMQNVAEFLACIQKIPAAKLMRYSVIPKVPPYKIFVIDGEFLPDYPRKLLAEGKFDTSKEVIVGFMTHDGDGGAKRGFIPDWNDFIRNGISKMAAKTALSAGLSYHYNYDKIPNKVIMENLIYQKYISCEENPLKIASAVLDSWTDAMFAYKAFEVAMSVAKYGGKTYLFEFEHMPAFMVAQQKPNIRLSAGHGQDLLYVFGLLPLMSKGGLPVTQGELLLTQSTMHAFSSFAKTGQPVYVTTTKQNVQWKEFTLTSPNYLKFTTNMTQNSTGKVPNYLHERMSLWLNVMKGIQHMDTCDPYMGVMDRPRPNNAGTLRSTINMIEFLLMALAATFLAVVN